MYVCTHTHTSRCTRFMTFIILYNFFLFFLSAHSPRSPRVPTLLSHPSTLCRLTSAAAAAGLTCKHAKKRPYWVTKNPTSPVFIDYILISRFTSFRILNKNMPEKVFSSVAVIVVAVGISPQEAQRRRPTLSNDRLWDAWRFSRSCLWICKINWQLTVTCNETLMVEKQYLNKAKPLHIQLNKNTPIVTCLQRGGGTSRIFNRLVACCRGFLPHD